MCCSGRISDDWLMTPSTWMGEAPQAQSRTERGRRRRAGRRMVADCVVAWAAMTQAEAAGYLTDVPYVRQFCKELAPPWLRAAAALNGFSPPPGDSFDYLELGCGTGDTLNTLAAAHPRARFL